MLGCDALPLEVRIVSRTPQRPIIKVENHQKGNITAISAQPTIVTVVIVVQIE